ncbi:MAG: cysteine synthase family protein [Clostridia bacterium]|nr:cysteine synthase family protein [Clostridia bacterium]
MEIRHSLTDLIGRTPMIRLCSLEKYFGLKAQLYAKLEYMNPSGSIKDRAALFVIRDAINRGLITRGQSVVEATSGNMGISLAMLSNAYGYRAVIVMPENMSPERRAIIAAYGGEFVLTDALGGMTAAIEMADRIKKENGGYSPLQFNNRQNLIAHYETTGREIYADLHGAPDILVAGVGTGGTMGGAGLFLKEASPQIKLIAVEPSESAVLSGEKAGAHGIQGIGAGFVPPLLDMKMIDSITQVSTDMAIDMLHRVVGCEGLFVGISSGAALSAAVSLGMQSENKGKKIAVILPDGGEKYLSELS